MRSIFDILTENMRMAEKILYFSKNKTMRFRSCPHVLIEKNSEYFFVTVYECYLTDSHEIKFKAWSDSEDIERNLYYNLTDTIESICQAIYEQKYIECKYLNRY